MRCWCSSRTSTGSECHIYGAVVAQEIERVGGSVVRYPALPLHMPKCPWARL